MYVLNKIVGFFINPVTMALLAGIAGFLLSRLGRGRFRQAGPWLVAAALGLVWLASTNAAVCLLGLPLERPYLASQTPGSLPAADAIVLLGGGISKSEALAYPDMADGCDRVWHAARLYRAGKAPLVVVSGRNDLAAAVPLLLDLGVPREAILVDNDSRNTYENSRFTERLLKESGIESPSALLVTSAWHMPRALGNFSRTSLRVVPAAADFKATSVRSGCSGLLDWIVPYPEALFITSQLEKEWIGRFARK